MFRARLRFLLIPNYAPRFLQQEVDMDTERPYDLVHCGSLTETRGSRILLEMLRILVYEMGRGDLRLLVIGKGTERANRDLREGLNQYGLVRNVEFRGYIPLQQVPQALAQAKIGLLCAQSTPEFLDDYSHSSKMFDYMAAGLPMISGTVDISRSYDPQEEFVCFVDQANPREYARAAATLLDDDSRRIQMGRRAREIYEEKYTAEKPAEALIEYYRECLDHGR